MEVKFIDLEVSGVDVVELVDVAGLDNREVEALLSILNQSLPAVEKGSKNGKDQSW